MASGSAQFALYLWSLLYSCWQRRTASLSSSATKDICGDWYKFLFDHFEIYGANFDEALFGKDG